MSPTSEDEDPVDGKGSSSKPEEAATTDAAQKQATKRRTKTGCLTCRKRRIKCGEEKPVCKNCIKSKRECAGYVQPLVYKQQTHGPPPTIHDSRERILSIQDEGGGSGGFFNLRLQQEQQYLETYPGFDPAIPSPYQQLPFGASYHAFPFALPNDPSYTTVPHAGGTYGWQNTQYPRGQPYPGMVDPTGTGVPGFPMTHDPTGASSNSSLPLDPQLLRQPGHTGASAIPTPSQPPLPAFPGEHRFSQELNFVQSYPQASISQPYGILNEAIDEENVSIAAGPIPDPLTVDDDYEDSDDPFDVEMDEQEQDLSFQDAANNLTEILDRSGQRGWRTARPHASRRSQYQTVTTFRPAMTLSPLRDERNEHIFCHFVEITSHCISIFERHHFSPISAPARTLWNFTIPALALSHPALAHAILALGALHLAKLHNTSEDPAVKHFTYAVRRVGKLLGLPKRRHEIATLATVLVLGFYEVVNGDHSRWNLHLSGATKLVLEHDFAATTRTARRMRQGAKARVNQWTAQFALTEENYARVAGIPLPLLDDIDWEVDATLVSRLTGYPVDDDHQVQHNFPLVADLTEKDIEEFKAKMDLRWWYCKQDIFQSMVSGDPLLMPFEHWIYCPPRGQIGRSDNPYATLDHLLLIMARLAEFGGQDRIRKQRVVTSQGGQWKPPKWLFGPSGPPGRPKGVDAGRSKQPSSPNTGKAGASVRSAGQTAQKASPAPSANEGRVRQSKPGLPGPGPTGGPPMLGMIPPSGDTQMHSAFKAMNTRINDPAFSIKQEERKSTSPRSPQTLEDDTTQALTEHTEIIKAFDLFVKSLGPDFEPLPHSGPPVTTPFGPAVMYKNAAVACIWAFYYTGRIMIHRLHPEMPPAAMVSAGVTAHLTRDYAQSIGRICAGLYSTRQYGQTGALDPSFAGAWMESTFPLLFAGIQYTDPVQRGWTISKLKDVQRRCGWQTSGAIAAACEMAWESMGRDGKGPPYERTLDLKSKDPRVSGAFKRSDGPAGDSGRVPNAEAEHESEFVNHDRSLIDRSGSTRTHWALGLLSVEEDINKMSLESKR
ncbi:uncharacterized protein Z518_08584 [Rhinocladiella mackenziei CBS 650.93]|uniref:Zn(2)-C6 fungal-type domain-containing protein n=1 Tax=Rhinocladiella mackenziei CBS 650.93 TaxID=1442369 RepID=A0A0D2FL11_9EURO|nr:uncharacterized protein Z518_08584 [Rhinocladiella mackenziei CBS 650.93]KIX02642.1 hypothetical protein Z518_08584 [Rhinocladiella mackenziei CBS 650.93]